MIGTATAEERQLAGPREILRRSAERLGGSDEARFQILEAGASRLGGFDLTAFQSAFACRPVASVGRLMDLGRDLVSSIDGSGVPPALALSSLAREPLTKSRQRTDGAYHTDHRLAQHLADAVRDWLKPGALVLDPACGAGMLLAAVALAACGSDRMLASEWMAYSVHAADLSAAALRGTLLSLASLTNDVDALHAMRSRWQVHDSLLVPRERWLALAPGGFDVVVGNPPWEKVKLSRHEFVKGAGVARHYGQDFLPADLHGYDAARLTAAGRSALLAARYATLSDGEPDLYVAFTELMVGLTKPGGHGALLVPGGLIRSQGTEGLRRFLLRKSSAMRLTVFDNKARFFPIDTRFKFLAVTYAAAPPGRSAKAAIELCHGHGSTRGVEVTPPVQLARKVLETIRPDLTIPEVRTDAEWRLFLRMQKTGERTDAPGSQWQPQYRREVDMTHARADFLSAAGKGRLPVVEGRMVQPHRFGAKVYVDGQGRAARWSAMPPGASTVRPQFFIDAERVAKPSLERSRSVRAGFCDITGQTNERSMMAALIPPGVLCGNKVPTVLFPNDPGVARLQLWIGIVNSLAFDWAMRRVVTTTVNYFLLGGLALPPLHPTSLPGRRLIEIVARLSELDRAGPPSPTMLWRIAELRAEADVLVARSYGFTVDDMLLVFDDFPLLDRGQPALPGEQRSTATRDLVLAKWSDKRRGDGIDWAARIESARGAGAVPYVPAELAEHEVGLRDAK
ncbi:Eco57I restriction-modification methylase domain-containing protein [Methylobacterium sp. D54C]